MWFGKLDRLISPIAPEFEHDILEAIKSGCRCLCKDISLVLNHQDGSSGNVDKRGFFHSYVAGDRVYRE